MVAVVIFLELGTCLLESLAVGQGEVTYVFCEIVQKFLFTYTADVGITLVPRDVHKVVQVTEHAHLAELGDSGQKGEPDVPVLGFQRTVERLERAPVPVLEGIIPDGLKHRLVILVHEDDHTLAGLGRCPFYYAFEPGGIRLLVRVGTVKDFPFRKRKVEFVIQCLNTVIFPYVQVQMQYRIFEPFLFQSMHGKSLEKLLLALEIRLQCTDEQTLAEPPRTAQEIIAPRGDKAVHLLRLVHIPVSVPAEFLEILDPYRI